MFLSEAAGYMNGVLHGDNAEFGSINTDTRAIRKGDLYFALKGENFDGHDFVVAAQKCNAAAAVVTQYTKEISIPQVVVADTLHAMGELACVWRKNFEGKVISITGSSGKTTVKGLLRSILALHDTVHATPGNWNNYIGVPLTLFGLNDQAFAVVEMGTNHPGEIAYLTQMVLPDVAIVTNVMSAHFEGFGSVDAIAKEKSAIYSHLKDDQTAVVNLDDKYAGIIAQQTSFCQQVGFSQAGSTLIADAVNAENIRLNTTGCAEFELRIGQQVERVTLSIPGLHNVSNALAAAACAVAVGQTIANIADGLTKYLGDKGRMQIKKSIKGAVVVDDTYNAHPGSMRVAIDYLSACTGKRILVLGDMGELGDIADVAHTQLGEYAVEKNIDHLYVVGKKSALAAKAFGAKARAFDSQSELSAYLDTFVDDQSTVLVKGSRSARMENVVNALCAKEKAPC